MAYTAIDDSEAYFQAKTYTGTGSSLAITFDGDTDMQPDIIHLKERNSTSSPQWVDSVRGATKHLESHHAGAETDESEGVTAFGSDGFTVGTNGAVNQSGSQTYVAWCWKESATSGVDIVAYTGNGTDDTDISHNLSAVPNLIIVKNRDAADAWQIYHGANTAAPETDYLVLNTTAATADAADRWSDEAPTSSVFTLGDADEVNTNTENYIAYLFAEKQGFSKFGSYTSNGVSGNGSFTHLGFRPAFVIHKQVSTTGDWRGWNNKSSPFNQMNNSLFPNTNDVEYDTANVAVDFLSNGIKWRQTDTTNNNPDGGTFIYMAWAEAPFVNSKGVPCNAR